MSIRFCSSLFFVLVVVGFAFACNSSCDAHGTCNADDDTCVCDDGYYGIDCSEGKLINVSWYLIVGT